MEKLVQKNEYKIVVPLFWAAIFAAPNKAQQFYSDLDLYQKGFNNPTENRRIQGLFKAFA